MHTHLYLGGWIWMCVCTHCIGRMDVDIIFVFGWVDIDICVYTFVFGWMDVDMCVYVCIGGWMLGWIDE